MRFKRFSFSSQIVQRPLRMGAGRHGMLYPRPPINSPDNDLFQMLPVPAMMANSKGDVILVNEAWLEATGITLERSLERGWQSALHPEDADAVARQWDEAVKNGGLFERQFRLRLADGDYHWLSMRATATKSRKGMARTWTATLTDVSAVCRQADKALHVSEEINRGLFLSSYECIKVLDNDFNLLSMNEGGMKLMEIADETLYLDKSYLDFWREEDKPRVSEALRTALRGEIGRFEAYTHTVSGKIRWWDVHVVALPQVPDRRERLLVVGHDLTENKLNEMALQRSEERLNLAIQFAGMAMWDADLVTQSTYSSPQYFSLLGYVPPSDGRATVQTYVNCIHHDDVAVVTDRWREAMERHQDYQMEHRIIRTDDGRTRWVSSLGRFVYNDDGEAVRFIGMLHDISERKESQAALEREHAFLREVINATPNMVFVKDWDGHYVLANDALANSYGTTVRDMIGKQDSDYNPYMDEVERFWRDDREVMSTCQEKRIAEETHTFVDGELHWFTTIKVPLLNADGSCDKVLGIATDITERKRTEEAMQQFRSALDSAADNIFLIDPTTMRFLDVSQSACRDLGYTREEMLELGPPQIMPQISTEDLKRRFDEIRMEPSGNGSIETLHFRKDNSSFEAEVTLRPVEIHGSQLVIAVARDITERKRAEEALRQSEERLKLAQKAGHVGVFDWDIVNDHAVITTELEGIFSAEPGTREGSHRDWVKYVHPEDLPALDEKFKECIRERNCDVSFEYRILPKKGNVRWVEIKGQISYNEDHAPKR